MQSRFKFLAVKKMILPKPMQKQSADISSDSTSARTFLGVGDKCSYVIIIRSAPTLIVCLLISFKVHILLNIINRFVVMLFLFGYSIYPWRTDK